MSQYNPTRLFACILSALAAAGCKSSVGTKSPEVAESSAFSDSALSLFDVAPTVLHLLGLPVPRYMQGKVADSVFDSQFLERQPVRFVDAYDVADRPRSDPTGEVPLESERIDKLKALGYLK